MQNWEFETRAIHLGSLPQDGTGSTTTPIYQSASFAYEDPNEMADIFQGRKFGFLYSRISNPSVASLEGRLAGLEKGRVAIATTSGLSAISAVVLGLVQSGEEMVVSTSLFGGTYYLLQEMEKNNGIKIHYVDPYDHAAIAAAVSDKTRLIFVETIGNPKLDIPDLNAISKIATDNNVPFVVDSTLTSPYLLLGKEWGIDVVIHSTTKYIGLGGKAIGGAIIDTGRFKWKTCKSKLLAEKAADFGDFAFNARVRRLVADYGFIISPFNAFLIQAGTETLGLRMQRHCENAQKLAEFLNDHPLVKSVRYPGLPQHERHELAKAQFSGYFGALLTFSLSDQEQCYKMLSRLKMVKNVTNLGDAKTLAIHPETTIYNRLSVADRRAAGVSPELIRISVGLEHHNDLIADFKQALEGSQS